jgi:membrane protein
MAPTDVRTALARQHQAKQQRSWWSILKTSACEWSDADAMTWAAAIACYTVLALAPLLVVAVKVTSVVLVGHGNPVKTIHDDVAKVMGTSAGANAIEAILDNVVNQKGGLIASIVSGILVVVSVGGVFAEIQQAMNRVWKLKPKPGQALGAFVRARLKSVVVLAVAAVVLLASLAIAGALEKLTSHFGPGAKFLVWGIDLVATLVALTLIFAMVFKTVPDAEIGWRTTVIGAAITAVLFAIGKYGLALYFKYGTPTSAFGALGSLAAILIWIYYSAQIVLFGAVFTQVFSKQHRHGVKPSKHAQFLSECDETETATPSPELPVNKPGRPGPRQNARRPDAGYAAVLGKHAASYTRLPPRPIELSSEEQMAAKSLLAAGAGIALGALLGGYGMTQMRRPRAVDPKRVAAAGLHRRLDRVQQKVGRASKMKSFLEQQDINERLDAIGAQIRASAAGKRKPPTRHVRRERWPERVLHAVKNYF